jgi:enoyl-CoA hydratase/carnithine racemase
MTVLSDYKDKYELLEIERRDGILQVTCDFNRKPPSGAHWATTITPFARDVSEDRENRIMILTGAGDVWNTNHEEGPIPLFEDIGQWAGVGGTLDALPRRLTAFLDIPIPTIAAVNGPALVHAEYACLCNIVIASEKATFQDWPHFRNGIAPGDGVHVVWPLLLGWNRGSYFLLMGQTLSAREALDLGVVNEVVPPDRLLPRAWEIAEQLASQDPMVLHLSKKILTHQLKQRLLENLELGLGFEGYGIIAAAQRAARDAKK